MRQNVVKVAHIDPAPAVLASHEVLPLVLRFTTTTLADNPARHDARTAGRSIMFPQGASRPNEAAFDAKSGLTFLITHLPLRLYGYRRRGRHIRGPKAAVARGRAVVCSFVAARLLSQCPKIHSTKTGAAHNAIHACDPMFSGLGRNDLRWQAPDLMIADPLFWHGG